MRLVSVLCAASAAALAVAAPASAATLVHYYDFTNGVTDLVGDADGTLVGGASVSGGLLHLDGVDDYVQFDEPLIRDGDGNLPASWTVFVRLQATPNDATYTEVYSEGNFYFGTAPGSDNVMRLSDAFGGIGVDYPSGAAFHTLFVTYEAGVGTKFYIDGVSVFESAGAPSTPNDATRLGRQYGGWGEYLQGQYDTLKVYDGVATYAEAAGPVGLVPEPATWALMVGGFMGTGAALRSRRTVRAG